MTGSVRQARRTLSRGASAAQADEEHSPASDPPASELDQSVEKFLTYLREVRRLSPHTLDSYQRDLQSLRVMGKPLGLQKMGPEPKPRRGVVRSKTDHGRRKPFIQGAKKGPKRPSGKG